MTITKDNGQLENVRWLRREMTPHERKLWYLFLRKYVACAHKLILPFKSACKALSVTFGDSSPRGRAKASACNCAIGHNGIRNGAHLYRYAPLTVLRAPR